MRKTDNVGTGAIPRFFFLSILLLGLAMPGICRAADDSEDTPKVFIVAKVEDLPARFRRGRGGAAHLLPRLFKQAPQGARLKLTIGLFYDFGHSASTNRMEPYIMAAVPLDDQGRPHGVGQFFSPATHGPCREASYRNGRKHGPERVYDRGPRGRYVRTEIPWENGKMHGTKKIFAGNGKLTFECAFVHGKQEGKAKSYAANGKVVSVTPYRNGKKEGKAVLYYPGTGRVKREVIYHNNKINGTTREYFKNGKLKRKMQIKDSLMHGAVELYDEKTGRLVRKSYFLEGENVSEAEFRKKYKP